MSAAKESADGENIYDQIGKEINEALNTAKSADDRLFHLAKAEEMILNQEGTSLLDNFLDEMFQFMHQKEQKIRCFVVSFIEKACKKDPEVMKKATATLSWLMSESSANTSAVTVQKKIINACTQLYAVILKWAAQRKSDKEVEECWNVFSMLKGRIMEKLDSDNEGIKTMAFKFLETVILCQTPKTEFSEATPLKKISRDHSFISYRMLASEAQHSFNCLLEQMSSSHISSLNLVTVIGCLCNVAKQRPEHLSQVISALESLHVNLPPTLGTSQVKSVRKELKMHLLRTLKHPASIALHDRLKQLLLELGASQGEISRAMPATSELNEALKRKVAAATAAALGASTSFAQTSKRQTEQKDEDTDLRDPKRLKLDDDEYDDSVADIYKQLDSDKLDSTSHATQKAVQITTDWVLERLSSQVVTKLVIISLYTLPDQMPAAFASSYTPIDGAGTDSQKQHLARMLAIQLTKEGEGPGIQYIKEEKQKLFVARQAARSEGAIIPPTPMVDRSQPSTSSASSEKLGVDKFAHPQLPTEKSKARIKGFNLLSIAKQLIPQEAEIMFANAFKRMLDNEKRAVQGGAGLAQQKLLVRLVTRYHFAGTKELEAVLLTFIINDQKNRTDLALLWLGELYSICMSYQSPNGLFSDTDRYIRYDTVLCSFLSTLHNRGEHKETLFHRLFLEVPLITPAAMSILKMACIDKVYGAFAMTTLRELILTRARQRNELLKLLLEFSYFERSDIRDQSVKTAKELYQIDYIRNDVRDFVIQMSELLVEPTAPKVIWHNNGRLDKQTEESVTEMPWDESLIRAGLHLFLSMLAIDHSLLHHLASVCARANTEIKRVTFRNIEQAIKSTGMQSEELLSMIASCPEGAETLVARIVHLLTERNPPTAELVDRVRELHINRNTDVRSLLPILTGLSREELLNLIPKFVLSATNSKSVPVFFKKLLFGRNIQTFEPLITPSDLIVELHRIKSANFKEHGHLVQNLDLLMVDSTREFNLSKEHFANSIEALIEDVPMPALLFHSLQKINENYPALNGFLSNVFVKLSQKKVWSESSELWPAFLKCAKAVGQVAFTAVITQLSLDEFKEYVNIMASPDLIPTLRKYLSSLPAHQQNMVSREILDFIHEGGK
ncbi:symplekin [Ditylenchus destructor]|nr:symplekin [Ditylenchus destructor]